MSTPNRPPVPGKPVTVKVWGNTACFTRPEFGVEQVSYAVMTPTAAKGLLEAIFWKPQFEWDVLAIDVLRPVRWTRMTRNVIKSRQDHQRAKRWAAAGGTGGYSAAGDRAQARSLFLRDVAYVIHADVRPAPGGGHRDGYRDQFRRRVARGQFFSPPFLGCREHLAHIGPADGERPIDETFSVGAMPLAFDRNDDTDPTKNGAVTSVHWLDGRVVSGRLLVKSPA